MLSLDAVTVADSPSHDCTSYCATVRRYEGEFHTGFVNGLGQYTGVNGEVYRGEWLYGKRHGCGSWHPHALWSHGRLNPQHAFAIDAIE